MPIYDGVVAFDDTTLIPVIVAIEADVVRLSADGTEIGVWTGEECTITEHGEGVFTINAEDETLRFLPRDAASFAAALHNGAAETPRVAEEGTPPRPSPQEAPDPKRITKLLFYLLAAMTTALGVWALLSLFF